jgi:hypothetical protein
MTPKPIEMGHGRTRAFVCGIVAIAWLVACGDDEAVDAAGGRELLLRVQTENYQQWDRPPGWEAQKPSLEGGHGGQLDIYVNELVASSLESETPVRQLPVGSTVVKDVWTGANLHAIAIMDKRADGWYWAEFNGKGEVLAAGHPEGCILCHRRGVDYVRAFSLQ